MLDVYELSTAEGREKYKSLLSSLDDVEPYFLLDYIDIFSSGFENLICFSFSNNKTGVTILMPGYLKPVIIGKEKTSCLDFITPYGYTGPLSSTSASAADITEFWSEVDNWYKNNEVVTEFIRFNLSDNHLNYSGAIVQTMLNVKGEIIDEDAQWTSFDHKVRKNVNKAKRENLTCEVYFKNIEDERIKEFFGIYTSTMQRTNAAPHFFYSFDEFKRFISNNQKNAALCTVYFGSIPVASELLLVSEETIYSFLGGTDEAYFDKRPNDFLKVEAINWARNQSIKYYVLGGGYGFEDGIFNYKKSFFPNNVVNYYSGRKIINSAVYDELIKKSNAVRSASGLSELNKEDVSFFPLYNKSN